MLTAWLLALLLAADWPQFRGPNATGVSESKQLPVHFGPGTNVVWKAEIPRGHSSPVIAGHRIIVTAAEGGQRSGSSRQKVVDDGKLLTICLDRNTGKILWKREAPRPRVEQYQPTNSPASPTPAIDSGNVYVFFGDFGLLSYTLEGKERWRLPLGPFNNTNGHGSSPIVAGKLVILVCDQDSQSFLLAVDKNTGRIAWKVDRPESTRGYSTPAVLRPPQGPAELIVPGAYQMTAYNAETGEKLWWIRGLSWQPKSAPVVDGAMVYAHWWEQGGEAEQPTETPAFDEMLAKFDANHDGRLSREEVASDRRLTRDFDELDLALDGYLDERDWNFYRAKRASRNRLIAVRHGGRGDLTNSNVVWSVQKFLPNAPSPLLYEGVLYLVKDGGIVTALDPASGAILKQGRLAGALDTYYASPVGGAGKVYFTSQSGKVTVVRAGADWEAVAVNDMDEECFATPVPLEGRLYVRTRSAVYCFEERN